MSFFEIAMSEDGGSETFGAEEFPKMPNNYDGFHVLPTIITVSNQ